MNESEEDADTADSHPENVDVQVTEHDLVLTKLKVKVKAHTFQHLTDGQLSCWELPHVLGDKSGSTRDS